MDYPQITSSQPTTIPAQPEKVMDRYWLERLQIVAPLDQTKPAVAAIGVRQYAVGEGGTKTFAPAPKLLKIADVFGAASSNTAVANALVAVLNAVQTIVTQAETPPAPTDNQGA